MPRTKPSTLARTSIALTAASALAAVGCATSQHAEIASLAEAEAQAEVDRVMLEVERDIASIQGPIVEVRKRSQGVLRIAHADGSVQLLGEGGTGYFEAPAGFTLEGIDRTQIIDAERTVELGDATLTLDDSAAVSSEARLRIVSNNDLRRVVRSVR